MLPILETERLILKGFSVNDAKAVQEMAGDYELYKTTLNIPHPYEAGMAESWIEQHETLFNENKLLSLAVVRKSDEALLGCITLSTISEKRRLYEIGYWIGKMYWYQGYGTEASRAIIDYGFEKSNANKIMGRHFVSNPGSGKIMVHCGMSPEGVLREDQLKEGQFVDIAYYGILRSEWESSRQAK